MNKNLRSFLLFIITITFFSCVPKQKAQKPTIEPAKMQMPKAEADLGVLIPFTRELYFKLRDNGLDIKKLKFYIDNTIALNKIATTGNLEINEKGTLINKKGVAESLIKITPQVAGMIEMVEADGVRLNFGRPNSTLKFINNANSPKFFTFLGDKVDKSTGTSEVAYNSSTYRASCEGCSSVSDVKLLIKQLDVETGMGKGTIEPGIGNNRTLNSGY